MAAALKKAPLFLNQPARGSRDDSRESGYKAVPAAHDQKPHPTEARRSLTGWAVWVRHDFDFFFLLSLQPAACVCVCSMDLDQPRRPPAELGTPFRCLSGTAIFCAAQQTPSYNRAGRPSKEAHLWGREKGGGLPEIGTGTGPA